METYDIEWNGKSHRAADITIFAGKEDEEAVIIADTKFEEELLSHMYNDDSLADSAIAMDDKLAYFIEPSEWDFPEAQIVALVEQSYL